MRIMAIIFLLGAAAGLQGCIRKGPYYIYGDYIEGDVGAGSDEAVPEGEAMPAKES